MAPSPEDASGVFLEYYEPDIKEILTLISFFFVLSVSEWVSSKIFKVGPIGQMIVGMLYGVPIGNILSLEWQQTFVSLGYIGLILIVFEGGLTINLDSMKHHVIMIAITGVISLLIPMAISMAYLYSWIGYNKVEAFIVGASLSSTSLGTTFVIISTVVKSFDFSRTRLGTILIGSVVLNDTVGLIVSSVIDGLGEAQKELLKAVSETSSSESSSESTTSGDDLTNIYWIIGRPIVAAIGMLLSSILLTKFLFGPVFRWYIEHHFVRFKHISNVILMVASITAFMTLASYAGTSTLLGAFTAGMVLARLPCTHPDGPFMVLSREHGETLPGKTPNFVHTFEKYFLGGQKYILEPMFFASVGFAIPFKDLWATEVLWKGAVYSVLMLFAKVILALLVPIYDLITRRPLPPTRQFLTDVWQPALIMGFGMVARGEIGLLTIQIGHNHTEYLSIEAFCVGIWAIILTTMVGPVYVGLLMRAFGENISRDPHWGLPDDNGTAGNLKAWDTMNSMTSTSKWTNRMLSRSISRAASRNGERPGTSGSMHSFGRRSSDDLEKGAFEHVEVLGHGHRRMPTVSVVYEDETVRSLSPESRGRALWRQNSGPASPGKVRLI